ncbi:hypothetical protein KJ763_02460 [Patescibacteria group bacterium]|nr:hypothetical protein [Patescibacteria group bacterium]
MNIEAVSKILSNPSWDLIVLFFFIAVGFFYGLMAGKSRMISFLVSLYISGFLFDKFYYLDQLIKTDSLTSTFMARIGVFLVVLFIINLLFSKVLRLSSDGSEKKWWQALLLSFLSAGLLFSYLFHLFPAKDLFTFSPIVQNIFASDSAFFWWLTLPLVALFFVRR